MFTQLKSDVFQDWNANRGSAKSQLIMAAYRLTRRARVRKTFLERPMHVSYKLFTSWLLSVEIPVEAKIGKECRLFHPFAVVINPDAEIGDRCIIRNGVTIGNVVRNGQPSGSPRIGNDVELGAGSVVIGAIVLGDNAVVGAGAVVVKDVADGATVVGNPARPLNQSAPVVVDSEQSVHLT